MIPLASSFPMIWASNEKTSTLVQHTSTGEFELTVPKAGGCAEIKEGGGENDRLFRHGLLMWCSWFLIGIFMICTNRWYTYLADVTGYLHAIFGWAVLGCNAFAAIDVVVHEGWTFEGPHPILGWIIVFGLILFTITGVATFLARKLLKRRTETILSLRKVHRILAFGFWAFSMAALTTGMLLYKDEFATNRNDYKYLPWLSLGVMLCFVFLNESYF